MILAFLYIKFTDFLNKSFYSEIYKVKFFTYIPFKINHS